MKVKIEWNKVTIPEMFGGEEQTGYEILFEVVDDSGIKHSLSETICADYINIEEYHAPKKILQDHFKSKVGRDEYIWITNNITAITRQWIADRIYTHKERIERLEQEIDHNRKSIKMYRDYLDKVGSEA